MPMSLLADSFTFLVPGTNLQSTAKRYTSTFGTSLDGLTLLFAHCIGSHKEQWEPTIEHIFRLQRWMGTKEHIREAWSFDWQSHGDAALLNATVLKSRNDSVSVVEWALALEAFIRLRLKEHRIVAIGHSAGTGAIMMSMRNFSPQNPPYIAVFLVEPAILSQELFNAHAREREESANLTMKMTLARRDSWSSKGAAAAYLKRRLPWKLWDPKVFDTYVNHGLHSIVTHDGETVVLKASKEQEAMAYPQFSPYIDSVALFRERCMAIPFHLIFGEKIDFMPRYIQDALIDPPRGLLPASATWVSNAGHLIVQENPTGLALAICDKLNGDIFQLKSRM